MAKFFLSLPVLSLLIALLVNSGGILRLANGQAPGQGAWCVAKPSTSEESLLNNINYACGFVNCGVIQNGGPCFSPNTLLNHASIVMNIYYQKFGRNYWNCNFTNSALISVTDPSYADCKYTYSK